MPTIDADGCPIHVEIEGPDQAPTVIFSNSLGTNLHMWDEQAKHLSRKFRVVRYDQRGHGKSGAPKMPYTLERLGKDVIAILDSLKIERAHFCGLSMGGFTGISGEVSVIILGSNNTGCPNVRSTFNLIKQAPK